MHPVHVTSLSALERSAGHRRRRFGWLGGLIKHLREWA